MHYNVYDVFYSLNSYQHVLAASGAIFRMILCKYTMVLMWLVVYSCNNNITLKMPTIVAEICKWEHCE